MNRHPSRQVASRKRKPSPEGALEAMGLSATFASEFVPKQFKEAMAKGAAAGRSAARKAREKASDAMRPTSTPAEASAGDVIAIGCEPAGA